VDLDFWWMDAGWYPCGGEWWRTGEWDPDLARFPRGLRAISDHGLTRGVRTLVWFEPERVNWDGGLRAQHPEWLLEGTLLNLGLPAARKGLTDHVDRTIREQGIHFYRQDFNMDPLDFWRRADQPEQQGLTENLHVQGYLAYWDELRRRHPTLLLASCASGGRRNDLETLRLAVPLHPTDYNYADLTVKQAFHHSLFQWFPFFGSNTVPVDRVDAYTFRSGHARNLVLGYDLRQADLDYEHLRALAQEWRRAAEYYTGDYTPLTPYNRDGARWIAWQFHRPDRDAGVVQAFRRPDCAEEVQVFRLVGLDPEASYRVTDSETGATAVHLGSDLVAQGLPVRIARQPGATVLFYGRP